MSLSEENPTMPLRDWFAGQALSGLMADSNLVWEPGRYAVCAYAIADSMLKVRGMGVPSEAETDEGVEE